MKSTLKAKSKLKLPSFESSEILKKAFLDLKEKDQLSLRKWSELVAIDASVLNLILNSKRLAPQKHLEVLASSLDLDDLSLENLKAAHTRDWLQKNGVQLANLSPEKEISEDIEIEQITDGDAILLKSWLHLAVLEFSTCDNFQENPAFLAPLFGVSIEDIRAVLWELEHAGFLKREKGLLIKKNKKMRIPTKRSRELIRNFHIQMLKKSMHHLQSATGVSDFENRLISGYTVAVHPKNLKKAKLVLEKALIEACTKLSDGECTEVYQVQFQLFPLTRTRK